MDKWKAIQVGGVTVLVLAVGAQVWKHPGDTEAHLHPESHNGPGQPTGRTVAPFVTSVTSTSTSTDSSAPPRWIRSM
jgi:hypothetical protein